jgi:hypothetical protein
MDVLVIIISIILGILIFFIAYSEEPLHISIIIAAGFAIFSFIILVPIVFSFLGWSDSAKDNSLEDRIVKGSLPLINQCLNKKIENPESIKIKGKTIFIDLTRKESGFQNYTSFSYLLSQEIRGHYSETEITAFLIARRHKGNSMGYFGFNEKCPAFQAIDDICVVYWPEMTPIGFFSLESTPPKTISVNRACYGDYLGNPYVVGNETISKITFSQI